MTLIVRCDDKHRLVSYLYGESSAEEAAAVESHLAACQSCAEEIADLREVRGDLAGWHEPDVDLGFTVTRATGPVALPPPRRAWSLPVWAQAAAAVLVLSAGAAVANLEIRYDRDGFAVRTGWNQPGEEASAAGAASPAAVPVRTAAADDAWKTALAESEQRLRAEFAAQRTAAPVVGPARTGAADEEILTRVRALIEESERRQQHELALRVAQVTQDFETQRRTDLVRIEQNMGQIEGVTGAEAARQRELLNYLVRVSQRR